MSNIGEGALKFMEVNSTDSIGTNQWVAASAARAKPASEFEPWPGGLRGDSGQTSKVAVAAGGALPVYYLMYIAAATSLSRPCVYTVEF